jgi:O-antigen/teichoic acid export membrane protein
LHPVFYQWLSIAYVGLVSLALSVLLARELGPTGFGEYGIALAAGAILAIFLDGGMRSMLLREGTRTSKQLEYLSKQLPAIALGHAITLAVLLSLLAFGIFFPHLQIALSTISCFLGVVLVQFVSASLRGAGRWSLDAGWQMGHRTLSAALILAVLFLGFAQVWVVLAAWTCASFLSFLLLPSPLRTIPDLSFRPEVYKVAIPLVFIDLATAVYFRSDILVLGWLGVEPNQIGQYAASYKLFEVMIIAGNPVGLLLFRRMRLFKGDILQFKQGLQRAVIVSVALGVFTALLLDLISQPLVAWSYGSSFSESAHFLSILAWALVFVLPNILLTQAALALELDRSYLLAAILAALINITLNLSFVPSYGALASAWTSVATEGVLFVLLMFSVFKGIKLKTGKHIESWDLG